MFAMVIVTLQDVLATKIKDDMIIDLAMELHQELSLSSVIHTAYNLRRSVKTIQLMLV